MIEKNTLVNMLKNKAWNKSIELNFKRLYKEETLNTKETIMLVNFEFDYFREIDLYNSIIKGSCFGLPLKTDEEIIEYIDYIESTYILKQIIVEDFKSLFNRIEFYRNNQQLTMNLQKIKETWILVDEYETKKVLILHVNNSVSFLSWTYFD